MKKKLAALAVAGASLGMFAVGAPSANAAHCTTSPSEHAQATAGTDHDHSAHLGWSSCTGSANAGVSDRTVDGPGRSEDAPGHNR